MIKRSIILHFLGYLLVGIISYSLILMNQKGIIFLIYDVESNDVKNFKDIYSALVSFYGGNLGFVIASVTIVFGIIDRSHFDKLFRKDTVSQLYIFFFLLILASAINAVISFFGMLFNDKSSNFLTFVIVMLAYWLFSFLYFIIIFFSLIKNTVSDRKNKLAGERSKVIDEMIEEGKSLAEK